MIVVELLQYTLSLCCPLGAKNVINACGECKVKRLIYNSFADVVFDGSHHIRKGDESMSYPWKVCIVWMNFLSYSLSTLFEAYGVLIDFVSDTVHRHVNRDEGSSRSTCFERKQSRWSNDMCSASQQCLWTIRYTSCAWYCESSKFFLGKGLVIIHV